MQPLTTTPENPATVLIYSSPACVQCTATYRAMDKQNKRYIKIALAEHAAAADRLRERGYAQLPVVLLELDGVLIDSWSGFRPDRIESLAELLCPQDASGQPSAA